MSDSLGKIDTATKELLKNDDVMRDIIKLGMPGVRTDDLKLSPIDGEYTLTLFDYGKEHAITAALKRLCDVRRLVTTVTDGNWQCVIIGVENQANEDNAMPFRVLLENVMGCLEQIVMLADKNRQEEQERRRAKKEIEKRAEAAGPEAAEGRRKRLGRWVHQ